MEERLQKILARAGLASRRGAETLISAGRVAVDGQVITSLGSKADPRRQTVSVDGKPVEGQAYHYWMINKPAGFVSTRSDPQGRPTVLSLAPEPLRGLLYPVGRLDIDSEGLVLLTNDGSLAYRLMHPRFKVAKLYQAWIAGQPEEAALERLRRGVMINGRPSAPAVITLLETGAFRSHLRLVLFEGRKREIRLMCRAAGHPVLRLIRLAIGPLELGDLAPGAGRALSRKEKADLRAGAGLSPL
ncbi:MAG: rRNA pseudouridine synthase [Desulfarculales bacterium]|jgi:pseudouridine synthase|nr:rRNA pseudouridine synthase [Desulfarculales bacterium]